MQQDILLQQIVRNISNLDNYLDYADYLQEQGDPRGKLIALDYQIQMNNNSKLRKIREKYFEINLSSFLGKLSTRTHRDALRLEWFMGFVKSAWFVCDPEIPRPIIRGILTRMVENPSFRLLQNFSLRYRNGYRYWYTTDLIIPHEIDRLSNLVSIDIGDSTNIPTEFCNLQYLQFISFNPFKFSGFSPEVRDYIVKVMNINGQIDVKRCVDILKGVVDEYGYHNLLDLSDWNPEIVTAMALLDGLVLTPLHWDVINFAREYYEEYQIDLSMRLLTKAIGKKLGEDKGNSKYLHNLFPSGSPAMQASRYAGVPPPIVCKL